MKGKKTAILCEKYVFVSKTINFLFYVSDIKERKGELCILKDFIAKHFMYYSYIIDICK